MLIPKIFPSLPKVKVPIGHIPQRLKLPGVKNPQGRLEILRQMVTDLVREERLHFSYNRALECRQYMERILQLAIHRGPDDDYTKEMIDWWIMEPVLRDKLYGELANRLRDTEEPYTYLIRLPNVRYISKKDKRVERYSIAEVGALEINGNIFDSLRPLEERRLEALKRHVIANRSL